MVLRVAIVGCGKIADGHVEEVRKLPQLAEVVGVCDLEALMAEQLATRYSVPFHTGNLDELLDRTRPDVVHVTTPPGPHLSITRRVLKAGCHVLVEKPLTPTLAESEELIDLVRQHDKKLGIGYTYYFDPAALLMREIIARGVIGEPIHVESHYGYSLSGPFGRALLRDGSHWVHRLPGRLLQNNIDHLLNKVVEFFRQDQPTITALGAVRRTERFGDVRDEFVDELRVVLHGKRITGYATFSAHAKPTAHYLRVFGTRNTVHVDHVARTVTLEAPPDLPSAIGRLIPPWHRALEYARSGTRNLVRFAKSDFQFFAGLNELLSRFYRCVLDNTAPPIPYDDILWVARVCDTIYGEIGTNQALTVAQRLSSSKVQA